MKYEEMIQIFKVLKTAYPRFYNGMDKEDIQSAIGLWTEMFANDDTKIVTTALRELINDFQYPPTIADVKEKIRSMNSLINDDKQVDDYWNEFKRCVGGINPNGELRYAFENLSEPIQKFVGEPSNLICYAMMDSEIFNSVTKGQFSKSVETYIKRENEMKNMLPETRTLLQELANNMSIENKGGYKIEYKQD